MISLDILYVGSDPEAISALLESSPSDVAVDVVPALTRATARLHRVEPDAIVVDHARSDPETIEFLREAREVAPAAPVFFAGTDPTTVIEVARERHGDGDSLDADPFPAERAERTEEADPFLEQAIDTLQDIYFVFDVERNFVDWNSRLNDLLDRSDEAIKGMDPLDIIAEHHHTRATEKITEVMAEGEATAEFDLVSGDGEEIPYEFTGSMLTLGGEREGSYICGIARDLRPVREREAELREQRDLVNRILATSPVAIAIMDTDGTITRANPAAEELAGIEAGEITNRNFDPADWDLVDESGEPISREHHPVARVIETHEPVHHATHGIAVPNGERRWVSTSSAPLFDDDGEFDGVITVMEDVTELKSQQASLEQRTDELDEALEEVRRSNAELEQFAYVVSHDLKEPLRMVSSYLQLIERRYTDDLDDDADEFIGYAVDGAERMRKRIDALLTYSRVGRNEGAFRPVDLNEIADRALSNLDVAIEESNADVTVGSLPTIVGDEDQLVRLFQNLVGNAVRHGGEEPTVRITAECDDDEASIEVADDGPGIPPDVRERIFDLFYSGADDSTGIGLAICEKIVSSHDGRIELDTEVDVGTTFSIVLPASDA